MSKNALWKECDNIKRFKTLASVWGVGGGDGSTWC